MLVCMMVLLVMVLGPVARRRGEGRAAMVAIGAHLDPAGGNGQARRGDLPGGLSDQEGRQDHAVSRRSPAGPDRVGLLSGLVLLEPDLGTVVVIGLVTVGCCFLGGARISHLLALGSARFRSCWCWSSAPVTDASGS